MKTPLRNMSTVCTESMGRATCHSPTAQCSAPKSYLPYHTLIIFHIVLNYDSDATQLGSDEDSATQYETEEWESVSDLYGTEKESDSSSHGSKPHSVCTGA